METFIRVLIGLGLVAWIGKDYYKQLLPMIAAMRYRWAKGDDQQSKILKTLLFVVPALAIVIWVAEAGTTAWVVGLGIVAGLVALALRGRAASEREQEQALIGKHVQVKVAADHLESALQLVRSAIPDWPPRGRLDFWVERKDQEKGSGVGVNGPVGPVGIAIVWASPAEDGFYGNWEYQRWDVNDDKRSMFAMVLADVRDEWVANLTGDPIESEAIGDGEGERS